MGVIQQGIKEGTFTQGDPRKTAVYLWGAINGILFLFEEEINKEIIRMDVEQLIDYTIDLFITAMKQGKGV